MVGDHGKQSAIQVGIWCWMSCYHERCYCIETETRSVSGIGT